MNLFSRLSVAVLLSFLLETISFSLPFGTKLTFVSSQSTINSPTNNPVIQTNILQNKRNRFFSPLQLSNQVDPSAALIPLKIIIAGAPASGKGTQCEIIKAKYGVVHLSTGDILRAAVKEGTELGVKAKGFMDAGQLVPDELIIDVVCARLKQSDCVNQGWLLDGFPRTKSQAEALSKAGIVPDSFVLLDVPEEILVERVTGRRTDPVTGKIYHMKFSPPENGEVAARLVQRSDDTEEKIKVRVKEFQSHISAIRSKYEDKMIAVDGSQQAKLVSASVVSSLDKLL